jgi:putative membrane protein
MVDSSQQRLGFVITALTVVALGVLALVLTFGGSHAEGQAPSILASINAGLNALASVALLAGYAAIVTGRREAHRRAMTSALLISALFLVGYLAHHAQVGSVRYRGTGWLRWVYFGVLVPHVVLAAVGFPLILLTTFRALRKDFVRHRAVAKITLPIWLFVSLSGVVVYFMLYHA